MFDTLVSIAEVVLGFLILAVVTFAGIVIAMHRVDLTTKEQKYIASVGTVLMLALVGYVLLFKDDAPVSEVRQTPLPSTVTAKDLPFPELGIPGHVAPEGKTLHFNYRKGEPPVAIHCRDDTGIVECKAAK